LEKTKDWWRTLLIKITSPKEIPGQLCLVDFEKAFDTVDHSFLFKTLATFGFGENLVSFVKTLYTDISSCVRNNGYSSEFFRLHNGVKQGCPLSALLFILVAEILAVAIRENENIKGIKVDNTEINLSQLADDTTFYVDKQRFTSEGHDSSGNFS
jgi:hypothetical protein